MISLFHFVSKTKWLVFFLFALCYAGQGIVVPIIIQLASQVNVTDFRDICCFALYSLLLWLLVYLVMYIENVLMRQIMRDCNLSITQRVVTNYYLGRVALTDTEFVSVLTQDLTIWSQGYLQSILVIPVFMASILVSIGYLLYQNLLVGSLFAIGGLLMVIPQFIFDKRLKASGKVLSQAKADNLGTLTDFGKGLETICSNQAEIEASRQVMLGATKSEDSQFHFYKLQSLVMFWTGPFKGVGLVIAFVIGFMVQEAHLTVTTLVAMMTASTYLINPLQQLLEASANIQASKEITAKILTLCQETEEVEVKENQETIQSIELESLSKTYKDKVIFDNIILTFSTGLRTLIIGKSGIGKSTLFKLFTGQDRNYSGKILFKTETGRTIIPSFEQIALIHQSPFIFHASLRDNITLYQAYCDDEVIKILQKVGLWQELGQDLDYYIDSQNLSGGQIMRIEIARVLIRNKPIILADEMTAALDDKSAQEIRQLLLGLPNTLIEIAHKYRVDDYDVVYQIKNQTITALKNT